MSPDRRGIHAADHSILEDLLNEQPDYIPLVANRLGMHLAYVESRCELLAEYGLIEPITNEILYVVTDRGESYLAGDLDVDDAKKG